MSHHFQMRFASPLFPTIVTWVVVNHSQPEGRIIEITPGDYLISKALPQGLDFRNDETSTRRIRAELKQQKLPPPRCQTAQSVTLLSSS